MIFWGVQSEIIGEYNEAPNENCKICDDLNSPTYKLEQSYFKLYGMGLFPLGKKYYKTCSSCNAQLKARNQDINLATVKNRLPGGMKFKYFAGWIVMALVFVGLMWLYYELRLDEV